MTCIIPGRESLEFSSSTRPKAAAASIVSVMASHLHHGMITLRHAAERLQEVCRLAVLSAGGFQHIK